MAEKQPLLSGQGVIELCDSIKDIHSVLQSVGELFEELCMAEVPDGNVLHIDFKKWGIRTITEDLIHRQYEKIEKIRMVYEAMQKEVWEATGRESKPSSEKGVTVV